MMEWAETNWFWLAVVIPALLGMLGTWMAKKWGAGYKEYLDQVADVIKQARQDAMPGGEIEGLLGLLKGRSDTLSILGDAAKRQIVDTVKDDRTPKSGGKKVLGFLGNVLKAVILRR